MRKTQTGAAAQHTALGQALCLRGRKIAPKERFAMKEKMHPRGSVQLHVPSALSMVPQVQAASLLTALAAQP